MASLRVTKIIMLVVLTAFLQACSYSIIVFNQKGTPEEDPNPTPTTENVGFYNGKLVKSIKTVVPLSALENGVAYVDSSRSKAGFYSVEYKITFGDMLRNTFTAGKRKAIRLKLVYIKPSNQ